MKAFSTSCSLILAAIIVFSLDSGTVPATETITESATERDPNTPIFEGAILSPVGAFGDTTQYVVSVSDDILCGVSQGRLKTFTKDNADTVISSYWIPHRTMHTFEYYQGYIYLPQGYKGVWIFDVRKPEKIRLGGVINIPVASYAEIEINEDRLFIVDTLANSLIVLSLENPEEPQEIYQYPLPEGVGIGVKVSIVDDRIYILCRAGLVILNAQDLSNPELLWKIEIVSQTSLGALVVKEPYVYVYVGHEIRIFGISRFGAMEQQAVVDSIFCSQCCVKRKSFHWLRDEWRLYL